MCRKLKLGQSPQKGKCADDTPGPYTKEGTAPSGLWSLQQVSCWEALLLGMRMINLRLRAGLGFPEETVSSLYSQTAARSLTHDWVLEISNKVIILISHFFFIFNNTKKSPYTLNYCCLLCWQVWEIRNIFQDATQMLRCNSWAVSDTVQTCYGVHTFIV